MPRKDENYTTDAEFKVQNNRLHERWGLECCSVEDFSEWANTMRFMLDEGLAGNDALDRETFCDDANPVWCALKDSRGLCVRLREERAKDERRAARNK